MKNSLPVRIPKFHKSPRNTQFGLPTNRSKHSRRNSVRIKIKYCFNNRLLSHCILYRKTYLKICKNPSEFHILCSCNTFAFVADSSCYFTDIGLWNWVADCYKCCVLQTAVATLQTSDCETEWLIVINVVCCRQHLLRYSQRIVILSGWLV